MSLLSSRTLTNGLVSLNDAVHRKVSLLQAHSASSIYIYCVECSLFRSKS